MAAAGVAVVGIGGYLAAQAVVGNEVEKALVESFERLDRSPSLSVSDVHIDKTLFSTTATATLAMAGYEQTTAELDMHIDHGILKSPVTGTIHPNEAFITGDIDIDMIASMSGVEGQLTADTLKPAEAAVDGAMTGLVIDVSYTDENRWRVDTQADEIAFTRWVDIPPFRVISPHWAMSTQDEESESVVQRMDIPRLEITTQGLDVYLEAIEFEAVMEPSAKADVTQRPVQNQNGSFRVADIGIDDTSIGSLSMTILANNWDGQAFQDYHEDYANLVFMKNRFEEEPESVDEALYRQTIDRVIENGYLFLSASPEVAIAPLDAHIAMPTLGLDFKPHLSAQMRFDGEALSREALDSLAYTSDLVLIDPPAAQGGMNEEQANAYLLNRIYFDVRLTTPPREVLMQLPLLVGLMIDPALEEQTLTWDRGQLTLNGETVM
ncbi:DUF945 family protein [Halomonas aquamarina]|uniref:DUF945 family protein n=1 Tax=Vreelandella aquamarina TaxID=77097 RepID=A0ACC5VSS3_9GAMM|nr:DUF945 family protein [Halomonas aquamarina]MBZ5486801.1 DUF945 family protein [Halomonas aquamarina]